MYNKIHTNIFLSFIKDTNDLQLLFGRVISYLSNIIKKIIIRKYYFFLKSNKVHTFLKKNTYPHKKVLCESQRVVSILPTRVFLLISGLFKKKHRDEPCHGTMFVSDRLEQTSRHRRKKLVYWNRYMYTLRQPNCVSSSPATSLRRVCVCTR